MTRRTFISSSAALAGNLLTGCAGSGTRRSLGEPGRLSPQRTPGREMAFEKATPFSLPLLEVGGGPYEMGWAIGSRFAAEIRQGFEARGEWWTDLKAFAASRPRAVYDTFLAAAVKHAPAVVEELRGWAEGSGVPFRELMIFNLKAEYGALRVQERQCVECRPSGCSTIVLHEGDRAVVAHNEDGDQAYEGRMFMLRLHPRDGPSVLCASYPGILPGNAPWVNERGVLMTTNFIFTREVRLGVGRYFLDRLAMACRTLDEALAVCRHPERAYAFHHVLASRPERRIVSLEVTPSRHSLVVPQGLYIHTNHLVHDALATEPQDPDYVGTSSMSRWNVLRRWRAQVADPAALTAEDLLAALASHEARPYSPCRHPEGEVRGATLLAALFDLAGGTLRICRGKPCQGRTADYGL